jgi:hypothetical protein
MDRRRGQSVEWVETLEDRQMFSGVPGALVVDSALAQHAQLTVAKVKVGAAKTPSIVGAFTGTVSDSNESVVGVITAVIKTQNAHGKITGYVASQYAGKAGHVTEFTGTIVGDAFTMTTPTTTVTGVVSDGGTVLTGSYVFGASGDSSTGHFVVTRHALHV